MRKRKGGIAVTLPFFSALALPLWCAMFALYFILRRQKLFSQSLIAKCAGTFLAVGLTALALKLWGREPFSQGVFWFFLLCMLADALLEISFLPGMGLFAVAHICLIVWLCQTVPAGWWERSCLGLGAFWWVVILWTLAMIAALMVFRRELPRMGLMAVAGCLYVGVLSVTLALSLSLPLVAQTPYLWQIALGALCFFISDLMVAKVEFAGLDEGWQKPIMLLYWLALYLISSFVWVLQGTRSLG